MLYKQVWLDIFREPEITYDSRFDTKIFPLSFAGERSISWKPEDPANRQKVFVVRRKNFKCYVIKKSLIEQTKKEHFAEVQETSNIFY